MATRSIVNGVLARDDGVTTGFVNADGSVTPLVNGTASFNASRALLPSDDGLTLECTAAGLNITVPSGLPTGFAVAVIPNGTTTVVSGGGTLLNGLTTSVARTAFSNFTFAIIGRASAANSYVVDGV